MTFWKAYGLFLALANQISLVDHPDRHLWLHVTGMVLGSVAFLFLPKKR